MKNIFKYTVLSLLIGAAAVSCEKYNEPETIPIQKPDYKSPDYYANLRAYKLSDHPVSFGWFGGWTAQGPSMKSFMAGLPDSLDIISLWSGNPYTAASKADLKYIQEVKGTRVCACLLLGWNNKGLKGFTGEAVDWPSDPTEREAALRLYADNLAKQYIEDGYQGFDIDYEPNVGTWMDVKYCPRGNDFLIFVDQLGKYFGPKSGTNRLLMIDGETDAPPAACAPYFNYAVAQAYGNGASGCQSKYDMVDHLYKPEQFIVTEDFEKHWSDGGQVLTQAAWNPTQGRKGGCGTYHMENDYNNTDMQYKWLRKAIQIMNPAMVTADGSYKPVAYIRMNQTNTARVKVVHTPSADVVSGEVEFPIACSREQAGDVTVTLAQNNALVESYNLANATFYKEAPDDLIEIVNSQITVAAGETLSADMVRVEFTGDLSKVLSSEQAGYLLPIEIQTIQPVKGNDITKSRDHNVAYIVITAEDTNIKPAGAIDGGTAADRTGWNGESDLDQAYLPKLFDGDTGYSSMWPKTYYSSAKPSYFTVDMTESHTIKGIQFLPYYKYGLGEIRLLTSDDGTTWSAQGKVTLSDSATCVEFYSPVTCRYFKVEIITFAYSYGSSFALLEVNAYM